MTTRSATLEQAIGYLKAKKRAGCISHWEIEISDTTRGMLGVRVTERYITGTGLLDIKTSATYYGRDLLSAAMRACAEVET